MGVYSAECKRGDKTALFSLRAAIALLFSICSSLPGQGIPSNEQSAVIHGLLKSGDVALPGVTITVPTPGAAVIRELIEMLHPTKLGS